MPCKKDPTLKTLCLKTVTTNIDLFKDSVLQLPPTLIDQIQGLTKRINFIHPQTRTLDIDCRMTGLENMVAKVIDTCKTLKELILRDSSRFAKPKSSWDSSRPIYDFTDLIRNLPKLKELMLLETCTDKLLCEIGQHCPNLRCLYVYSIDEKAVTKLGVLALCTDPSTGKSRNLALCDLTMLLPNITVEAYYEALRNLPHLTIFFHHFWKKLFPILESEKAIRIYPLLKWCNNDFDLNSLRIAISVFPNLRKISISNRHDESLTHLMTVISDIMGSLTELSLKCVYDFDFSTVATGCPKLQILDLSDCSTKSNCQKMKTPFEWLTDLILNSVDTTERVLLDILVNSPGLTSLGMHDCPSFSNSLVTNLCKCNALSKMRKLDISYLEPEDNTLSLDGFKQILSMKNPLKSFSLYAAQVDRAIYNDLEKFIAVNNLDVDFEFKN